MIATVAAEHADFRMMLNARQLAHIYHRHVAVLANRRWDFAGGGGRLHEGKIRLSKWRMAVADPEPVGASELVKIMRRLRSVRTTRVRSVIVMVNGWSIPKDNDLRSLT
jgi:hypothetical protein